jgi:signal peptidase I
MQSNGGGLLRDLFILALLIVLVVIPLRVFVVSPFVVDGESMHPTFENLDYLIVDELVYRFSAPERGDVVVFRYPKNPSVFYIKRVIGLPGEKMTIQNGVVAVTRPDGTALTLKEPYVVDEDATYSRSFTLNAGEYFVMGDNRPNSSDSRVWGPLPRKNIIGRVDARLLPASEIGLFPGATAYGSPEPVRVATSTAP